MKTSLDIQNVTNFISKQFGGAEDVKQMVEGEESQAFSFRQGASQYVIRIAPDIKGFLKDAYAYQQFNAPELPIPKVVKTGNLDERHVFCISEMMSGITLQDANEATVTALLASITDVWKSIGAVDIQKTQGFGDFSHNGNAPFRSWRDYLLSILNESEYKWTTIKGADKNLVASMVAEFTKLVEKCPEERRLVHGDFGSNNILISPKEPKITAIIDWENALYGDPLFDIAIAHFWRTWLMCMEKTATYWEEHLGTIPAYKQRIKCYQLRIGLHEIYDNASDGDTKMLGWLQERCKQILNESV